MTLNMRWIFAVMMVVVSGITIRSDELAASWRAADQVRVREYWKEAFPGVAEVPATLTSKLSPLTASEVHDFSKQITGGAVLAGASCNSNSFCKAAGLVCGDNALVSPDLAGGHQSYARTEVSAELFNKMSHDPTLSDFFREKTLVRGATIRLPRLDVPEQPPRKFLPRELTQSFVLSHDTLPSLLTTFSVPRGSALNLQVHTTMFRCLAPPTQGESKQCVSSMEELTDFAMETFGDHHSMMSVVPPQDEAGSLQTGKLLDVSLLAANTPILTCHDSMYPFQVYYCHAIDNTKVYKLTIQLLNGHAIHKMATCHMDTSQWPALHPAFAVLHTRPGDSEACHYIVKHDLLFFIPSSANV